MAAWKARIDLAIALILASVISGLPATLAAQDEPPNLAKLIAHRESETEAERNEYMYRQTFTLDELDSREELEYSHKMLETGSGADRQLRVFQETGDLKRVVDYIIEETEAGLAEDAEAATVTKVG